MSEEPGEIWGTGLFLLARGDDGGGGAVTEAVATGCLSCRNTSIMVEVGGKAWRLANGLCTAASDGFFRSACRKEKRKSPQALRGIKAAL